VVGLRSSGFEPVLNAVANPVLNPVFESRFGPAFGVRSVSGDIHFRAEGFPSQLSVL
jgi:hypothetical protein